MAFQQHKRKIFLFMNSNICKQQKFSFSFLKVQLESFQFNNWSLHYYFAFWQKDNESCVTKGNTFIHFNSDFYLPPTLLTFIINLYIHFTKMPCTKNKFSPNILLCCCFLFLQNQSNLKSSKKTTGSKCLAISKLIF